MTRATGIDVSKWNGKMDWGKAGSKVDFAFIRAGSITASSAELYEDYQFIRNSGLAPEHVDFTDYYWYFRPQYKVLEQADFFSNLIEATGRNLRPVCDSENNGGLSPSKTADSNAIFCNRVNYNLGVLPLIYTRTTFWNPYVADRDLWEDLDLWIARYSSYLVQPWYGTYLKPRDWDAWNFWQYSADGNGKGAEYGGSSKSMDLNYFNGTPKQLAAYSNAISPIVYPDLISVSRKRNTILYELEDTYNYKSVLHPGHKMVVDGIYVRESDGTEFYVVGDGLVRKDHCAPIT